MGAVGAESQEEVGERIGTAVRGAGGRGGKERGKWVDLLRVNKIEAVQVGQDVCRLLEYTMKLTEGNSSSVNEANLVSMWLHLEEPYGGPAAETAG